MPAILLAIVVYAVCVVVFRGVSYDDVVMLPKGTTLARLLRMKPQQSAVPQEMAPQEEIPEEQAQPVERARQAVRPEKTDPFPGRVHPPAYAVNHEK